MLSERILCPLNWSQHRFLFHEMRVDALRRILWLSLMPIDAFYGYPFEGYPFDSLFAGGNFSGSECSPRPVAVSPVVIFLAVTGAPHRCRGRRIIPACHDTDRCAAPYVSRRVSVPRHRQMCRFVRVAVGFRTENAVSVPRHRQGRQMVGVAAGRRQAGFRRLPFAATTFVKVCAPDRP